MRELLLTLYITAILVANVVAGKILSIPLGLAMPAGIVAYPLTYVVAELIVERSGKGAANRAVLLGFLANIVMVGMIWLGGVLPAAPFSMETAAAYDTLLGLVPRIVLGSMVAYLASQLWNVYVYAWFKERIPVFARAFLAQLSSHVIDSTMFITVAFLGLFPVGVMILTQILFKMAISLFIGAPLVRMFKPMVTD